MTKIKSTNTDLRNRLDRQWNGQNKNDEQWSTKHYIENWRLSNTDRTPLKPEAPVVLQTRW